MSDEIGLSGVVGFVILGLVMTVVSMVTLWLVTGHFVRFDNKFRNQNLLKLSVIIALLWGYINGFSRLFLNTNYIADTTVILQFRCDDVVTFNYMNEQFNQYGLYIFLLARLRQFDLFKNGMYYFLIIMISYGTLFTMITTPFYVLPTVSNVDNDPEILLCGPGSVKDADTNLFAAYVGCLTPDTIVQIIFFAHLAFKSVRVWSMSTRIIQRTLIAAMLTCLFNIVELFLFIGAGGLTIHGIRIVFYCFVILLTFEITLNTENGDSSWCLWCKFEEDCDDEKKLDNMVGSVNLSQVNTSNNDKES